MTTHLPLDDVSVGGAAVTDEGRGYADEPKEVFGLAFVAAVKPAAPTQPASQPAGQPGHSTLDYPPVAAEPLRGLDALASDAVADAAFAEPSAQVDVVVSLVRVQFRRLSSAGSTARSDRWSPAHERLQAEAVVHVGARDAQ